MSPGPPVECPNCGHTNPQGALRCSQCASVVSDQNITLTHVGWTQAAGVPSPVASQSLAPGMLLAGRYEIVKMLGQGGMGAVYKAQDVELDRPVAIKVIRTELAGDAKTIARFKQELILARQVTHKNVIRIFDLGSHQGVRFITMEFVDGRDLSAVLGKQKFKPEEAARMVRQVCRALEAAHAEKVIHRDLKPQNIMVDDAGTVRVMDFGLARSVELSGLTQTGAILGTPAYMSPEQAKGTPVDERSDLFSLGIILYEMLTGQVPFQADTAWGTLIKRTQTPAPPPATIDPTIPDALSAITARCLAIDPAGRYQSAAEVAADLSAYLGDEPSQSTIGARPRNIVTPRFKMMAESTTWKWIAVSLAATLLLAAGVWGAYRLLSRPAAPFAPMTVIIADFDNHTGDAVFSGTLESTLRLALQGASFINAYDRTRLGELGVRAVVGRLDDSKAQEIAAAQGLNVMVSGAVDRSGAEYRLSLRAVQIVTGKVIVNADETAAGKDQVLFAVSKLGTSVRKALGDSTSESAQRFSMETLTAASLESVHEYAAALDVLSQGKLQDALKHFSQAVDLDANFGLAYAGMAVVSHNLGRDQDAEKYVKEAITKIDHMTERERFRTRAFLYLQIGDQQKCVDEYGALLSRYPSDTGALNNMALCSSKLRKMAMAVDDMRRVIAILPKRALYHVNLSVYGAYNSDFQTAAKEAGVTLKLNPSYGPGIQAEALAAMGQEQVARATEAYQNLQKVSPSDAATGLADVAVFEGRYRDAVGILEKGAAADRTAGRQDDAADKFAALAYAQVLRAEKGSALQAAKDALAASQAPKTRFVAGRVYVALGEASQAKELADSLSKELQIEPQVYGELLDGEIALKNGDGRGAVQVFTRANSLLDTWIGRFDLGRAYLDIGAFPEADSEFDRCLNRRGEALSLFVDIVPTYGYLPAVYYYQGRAREGMKSAGFAESYKKYWSIRGKAGEDPFLPEVRKRIGG